MPDSPNAEEMMQNPDMMRQMMNNPMMESMMNNPDMMRQMMETISIATDA